MHPGQRAAHCQQWAELFPVPHGDQDVVPMFGLWLRYQMTISLIHPGLCLKELRDVEHKDHRAAHLHFFGAQNV